MPTSRIYVGESAREYPFPPIMRILTRGEQVDFERDDQVPDDGRFEPLPAETEAAAKPTKATKAAKASEVKE